MKLCPAFELCSCVTFVYTLTCKGAYVHSPHCFWFGFHTLPPQIDTKCYVISECQTAVQDLPSSPGLPHTPLHHIIYMPPGIPIYLCTNLAVQRAHSLKNLHQFEVHHLLTSAHSCMNKLQTMPTPIQARRSSRYLSLSALSSSSCRRRTVFEGNRMLSGGRHGPTLR